MIDKELQRQIELAIHNNRVLEQAGIELWKAIEKVGVDEVRDRVGNKIASDDFEERVLSGDYTLGEYRMLRLASESDFGLRVVPNGEYEDSSSTD